MEQERWFSEVYDRQAESIWRYFMIRLNNAERADELTHDVFLKFWEALQKGVVIEYERAYLYLIAKRLFLNEIRQKRDPVSYEVLAADGFDVLDVTERADREAESSELTRYLNQLRDSYREVLVLRYLDGLPVKEIALLLDEKETNISMRINRGLAALKALYDNQSTV